MHKLEKEFDFLEYHFSRQGLQLSSITLRKHVERINRLYEKQTKKKATSSEMALVQGNYAKRIQCWSTTELGKFKHDVYDASLRNLIKQGQTRRQRLG
jgi:hypothetical protein